MENQRGLNTKRPKLVFFLGATKPLPSYDGKPKWKQNGQHARRRQTTMVPGRDRYPSTWRTGLIAPSNK